jgi:hypothetical protein
MTMRIVFWFSGDEIVVDDICGESDDRCSESREHAPVSSAPSTLLRGDDLTVYWDIPEHCAV